MDNWGTIVPYLFLATFVIVLVFALAEWRKTRRAQKEHHRSVAAEVNHEPQAGTPGPR